MRDERLIWAVVQRLGIVLAAVLLALLFLAGCGGALTAHSLQLDAGSLHSLAAEGRELATAARDGSATTQFTATHAADLASRGRALAQTFASRPAGPGLAAEARRLSRLAGQTAAALGELHASPAAPAVAARVHDRLTRIAAETAALERRL